MDDFEKMCTGAGPFGDDEGCYIATAVYGSYDCPPVWTLRRFRDDRLKRSALGRRFIRTYYALSPKLVRRYGKSKWLRRLVRIPLDGWVAHLQRQGVMDTPYQDIRHVAYDQGRGKTDGSEKETDQ